MSQPYDPQSAQRFPTSPAPMPPQSPQPYGPQPPYYPPPPQMGYATGGNQPPLARPTSGLATASMVLGIIGLLVGWCSFGIPSIIAVFLGHAALKETKTGVRGGHGMAIAGLILGYILALPMLVFTIVWIVTLAHSTS